MSEYGFVETISTHNNVCSQYCGRYTKKKCTRKGHFLISHANDDRLDFMIPGLGVYARETHAGFSNAIFSEGARGGVR